MAKKKQSKVSWRKRGATFEEAALVARQQADLERRTGGSIAGLSDNQLFEIQPAAASKPKAVIGHRTKRTGGANQKPLWVERVVAANPHIPLVVKRTPAPAKRATMLKEKLSKVASGMVQHRAQKALATLTAPAPTEPLDIWGGAASVDAPVSKRRQRPQHMKVPEASTTRAAVVVPAEGASWNPTHEAHQQLLAQAVEHELDRQKRDAWKRSALFSHSDDEDEEGDGGGGGRHDRGIRRSIDGRQEGVMEPLIHEPAADDDDDDDDDETAPGAEGAMMGVSWHVDKEKLTKAQRAKRERAKAKLLEEQAAKAVRTREKQLGRLGNLISDIKKEGASLQAKQLREAAIDEARPKKLGGKRHAPKRPDVLLSDEQPAALRQMVTEGSLLADRFDSLCARNLIEVRDKRKRDKNKFGHHGQKGGRRTVLAEGGKAMRFKSPHYRGPLPAWM